VFDFNYTEDYMKKLSMLALVLGLTLTSCAHHGKKKCCDGENKQCKMSKEQCSMKGKDGKKKECSKKECDMKKEKKADMKK